MVKIYTVILWIMTMYGLVIILKIEALCSSETSGNNYQTKWSHTPEDHNPNPSPAKNTLPSSDSRLLIQSL